MMPGDDQTQGEAKAEPMTDQQIADDYRERLKAVMQPVIDLMVQAKGSGFTLNFAIAGDPPAIAKIRVEKTIEL
jgi:hypothetical protein